MMTANTLIIATTALVGLSLTDHKALATLPIALQWIATMATAMPAALLMQRVGRRAGLMGGVALGIGGGILCTAAIIGRDFALFCIGSLLVGAFSAFGQQYRFAAADAASGAFRSRAVSLVVAGGVVAAFAGPNLANWTRDLLSPTTFAGSYAANVILYTISLLVLAFVKIPRPRPVGEHIVRVRAATLLTDSRFVVAAASAMIGYGVMNLVMTATPLAMRGWGFAFSQTATVIQWHVLAMFVPSFFTGHLIRRFGVLNVIMAGAVLQLACILINVSGQSEWNFTTALVLLGLGWNFLFVGGTTLLAESHDGPAQATAQGLNDFLVFGTVALTAISSGALHHTVGWISMNIAMTPFVIVALVLSLWLHRRLRGTPRGPLPG